MSTSRAARILAGVLIASAVVAVPAAPAAPSRDARLTASIREALRTTAAPGAIVGVWQPGRKAYVRTFGVRNATTRAPMRRDLHMRIGSETKTFTVTALLQLAEQGRIALEDPIAKYVPGVPNGDAITLRQLASMRSGLANYTETRAFEDALHADPFRVWTPPELLGLAFARPTLSAPGGRLHYSNTNTILLGLVIEQVSGEPLGEYIERHVTRPLGMTRTSFPTTPALPAPHARGYANDTADRRTVDATNWDPSWTWSAGQMVSTLDDLRTWVPRLVTGRGLLSAETQRIRLASVSSGGALAYGIGLLNVRGWIGHNGSLPGYQTLALHRPETRTTIVALMNSDVATQGKAPSDAIGQAITEVISPRNVYSLGAAPE